MPEESRKKSGASAIISLIVLAYLIWKFWGGGIERDVASDAIKQYQIAARQGDQMQICVQAGLVAAAFLQAKDESKYRLWKQTERHDCVLAGVSQ